MPSDSNPVRVDAIVLGGSYAGLSAAMQLARARRAVLVIDAGLRRNRFAESSHGFLGQDGRAPAAIAADGKAQLLAYPEVRWLDGAALHAEKVADGFAVQVQAEMRADGQADGQAGQTFQAKRLVLATGSRHSRALLSAGARACFTAPTATATSSTTAASACLRSARCRSTTR